MNKTTLYSLRAATAYLMVSMLDKLYSGAQKLMNLDLSHLSEKSAYYKFGYLAGMSTIQVIIPALICGACIVTLLRSRKEIRSLQVQ